METSVVPAADPESHVRPDEQVSWRDVEAGIAGKGLT